MGEHDQDRSDGWLLSIFLALPLILFLPFMLSALEASVFGTHHVEGFFRQVGLHDELSAIYKPIVRFFERLFN